MGAICDEKAGKAMVDAAKLAAELGAEQEASMALSKNHKLADIQVKDMQTKLDEADMNALKGGKKAMNKLESRIRELQSELEAESRRHAEGQRNLNKSERHIQELPSLLLKTVRITKECKAWLKVSRPRSSHTRHKLKERRKLPLLTWQSSVRSKEL